MTRGFVRAKYAFSFAIKRDLAGLLVSGVISGNSLIGAGQNPNSL